MAKSGSAEKKDLELEQVSMSSSDQLVRLAAAFVQFSIKDGARESLSLANEAGDILKSLRKTENNEETRQANIEKLENMLMHIQFFDRVSQRLEHAVRCLKMLMSVRLQSHLDDKGSLDIAALCDYFNMEDERSLYDNVKKGMKVEDAIELAYAVLLQQHQESDSGDNIEYF